MGMSQAEIREIMAKHAAALTLYARSFFLTESLHHAEEIVQDAFFQIYREKKTPENVSAWLYKAVRNGAVSRLRSEQRRRSREQAWEQAKMSGPWFVPDPTQKLDAEHVARMLQTLDAELREIIVLAIWGERSFAEIAELTGLSKTTVFRRYEQGLATLRKRIQGTYHNE